MRTVKTIRKAALLACLLLLCLSAVAFAQGKSECTEHSWKPNDAENHICENCQATEPHVYENGVCCVCDYSCPQTHTCKNSPCPTCGLATEHHYDQGFCTECGAPCPQTHTCMNSPCPTCGLTTEHVFSAQTGMCIYNCGTPCPSASLHTCNQPCSVCGYQAPHSWLNGLCTVCQLICTSPTHPTDCSGGKCDVCKLSYMHHYDSETGLCEKCGAPCPSASKHSCMSACPVCGYKKAHVFLDYGKDHYCKECGLVGEHIFTKADSSHKCEKCERVEPHAWKDGVCTACGYICTHHKTELQTKSLGAESRPDDIQYHNLQMDDRTVCMDCSKQLAERLYTLEEEHVFGAFGCECGFTDESYQLLLDARNDLRNRAHPIQDREQSRALELLDVYVTEFINGRVEQKIQENDEETGKRFVYGAGRTLHVAYWDATLTLLYTQYDEEMQSLYCTFAVLDPAGEGHECYCVVQKDALDESSLTAYVLDNSLKLNVWSVEADVFALDDEQALSKLAALEGSADSSSTSVSLRGVLNAPGAELSRTVTLMLNISEGNQPRVRLLIANAL